MDQAATQTGAEVSARPDASATPSVHERLKAHLNLQPEPQETDTQEGVAPDLEADSDAPAKEKAKPQAQAEDEAEVTTDDAQSEEAEVQLSSFDELAEALGWDQDKILDLNAKVKIDGKDGTVRLRDLVKSHQLEGHLNQKLMTHAEERKAFEAERLTKTREQADKLLRLDAGLQTLQKALEGEFNGIDWNKLQAEDPLEFNKQWVGYQQRFANMQNIANQIAQEQQHAQHQAALQRAAYLDEQKKLLHAKVPEWADDTRRNKDKAEILAYLKDYGISKEEFEAVADHRQALVIRDAWNWAKLQKAKPAVLNKVKLAPKLLKPGTQQSRAAQNDFIAQKERERLRKTGRVSDAKAPLKRLLFQ